MAPASGDSYIYPLSVLHGSPLPLVSRFLFPPLLSETLGSLLSRLVCLLLLIPFSSFSLSLSPFYLFFSPLSPSPSPFSISIYYSFPLSPLHFPPLPLPLSIFSLLPLSPSTSSSPFPFPFLISIYSSFPLSPLHFLLLFSFLLSIFSLFPFPPPLPPPFSPCSFYLFLIPPFLTSPFLSPFYLSLIPPHSPSPFSFLSILYFPFPPFLLPYPLSISPSFLPFPFCSPFASSLLSLLISCHLFRNMPSASLALFATPPLISFSVSPLSGGQTPHLWPRSADASRG